MMQAPDIGGMIFEHTADAHALDLPFVGHVALPQWEPQFQKRNRAARKPPVPVCTHVLVERIGSSLKKAGSGVAPAPRCRRN